MKTSNKLLLVFFLAMFFSAASLMVYAKSQMGLVDGNNGDYFYGDGPVVEKLILDDMQLSNIEMGDNFKFTIDPNSTSVSIKGDSAFISKLSYVTEDKFRILTGKLGYSYEFPDNVYVTVGVKNLEKLDLDINGNARVMNSEPLSYENVGMEVNGNGRVTLDLTAEKLDARINGNGKFTLNGTSKTVDASVSGNGRMYFENCELNVAKMNLSGNGKFYGGIVQDITGHASGNAKIEFQEVRGVENVSTSGNGRFTIRN